MKRTLAMILAVAMILGCFAACGKGGDTTTTTTTTPGTQTSTPAASGNGSEVATKEEDKNAEQVVKIVYTDEVSDWNPLHPSAAGTWCNYIDTLVEYDNYGLCQPCLAESWEKSVFTYTDANGNECEGQKWVFKIREGVKWQKFDGTEYGANVVAEDWATTAKWILDPVNAARTADLMFDIVGAEDYFNAMQQFEDGVLTEAPDFSTVGVKALSEYELEITLQQACPYFLSRLTYNWGYPTNAQFLEEMGDKFGTNNQTFLYCGAFLCTTWEQNSYRVDERNPIYWDAGNIHIERIERTYNAEANTIGPELLLRGEITSCDIPSSQIDEWMSDPAKKELIRPSRPSFIYSYFYLLNAMPTYEEKNVDGYQLSHEQWTKCVNNVNFRKAFYYGLDRVKAIGCYDPFTPEVYEFRAVTPDNAFAADGVDYIKLPAMAPWTEKEYFEADTAVEYMNKAVEELTAEGVTLPIVIYMPYVTESTEVNLAVVVSQQLEDLFNKDQEVVHFVVEGYPDTNFLSTTRRAGNYSFMMSYWGPDYADPETWTDPFNLGQAYNYIWHLDGYATQTNAEDPNGRKGRTEFDETYWKDYVYNEMVKEASAEVVDLSKRYNMFAEAEAWLLDQAVVVPLGNLDSCGYTSSYLNPFESLYAAFGCSSGRYKYQVVMNAPMSTETYLESLEVWEQERADRISAAQAAGIDY